MVSLSSLFQSLEFSERMICRNVFAIFFGASGPGVRSIQKIAQWDIDFSYVGIVKDSNPCDQPAVSEGRPLELLQEGIVSLS